MRSCRAELVVNGVFNPHGQFHIALSHQVVKVVCKGAWNLETMQLYAKACSEQVRPLFGQQWAMLSDINEWELATPDVEPLLIETFKQAIVLGLKREAVVNSSGTVKLDQFNITLPAIPNDFERRFFTTESEARQWLAEEGFMCDF